MKKFLMSSGQHVFLVGFFVLVVFFGFVTSVAQVNPIWLSVDEKRDLAMVPEINWSDLGSTVEDFDSYFFEHFGMRNVLICSYNVVRHFVLRANSAENKILEFLRFKEFFVVGN